MRVHEIEARSILLKRQYIDSWFVSRYGMNLYRGCQHNPNTGRSTRKTAAGRQRGSITGAYGYAARAVARWEGPLSDLREKQIPGISGKAGSLIREILSTGSAKEYERLLYSTGVSSEFPHSTH